MNSADTASGIYSELLDLGDIPLRDLRTLDSTPLHRAMHHVVDRTAQVRVLTRSSNSSGAGERVD